MSTPSPPQHTHPASPTPETGDCGGIFPKDFYLPKRKDQKYTDIEDLPTKLQPGHTVH